jgi:hypothetical protein
MFQPCLEAFHVVAVVTYFTTAASYSRKIYYTLVPIDFLSLEVCETILKICKKLMRTCKFVGGLLIGDARNTKGGSITVLFTSCFTGFESAV